MSVSGWRKRTCVQPPRRQPNNDRQLSEQSSRNRNYVPCDLVKLGPFPKAQTKKKRKIYAACHHTGLELSSFAGEPKYTRARAHWIYVKKIIIMFCGQLINKETYTVQTRNGNLYGLIACHLNTHKQLLVLWSYSSLPLISSVRVDKRWYLKYQSPSSSRVSPSSSVTVNGHILSMIQQLVINASFIIYTQHHHWVELPRHFARNVI